MSLRTCHGRRGAATLALGLAGLMLVSCTPTGVGGLPARPLKAQGPVLAVPMSLTASDGTGLKLVSLKARAVVEEPLAFTELHLVFENPTDRTIEGRFEINMPPNAAISRFAMQIYGQWQEGEVVERRAAQVAFEDALHRKQDPALLENKAGNAFSARVFPILPRERKELIVSYSQELPSSAEPYRLPLRGLPELADLDASVILREPAPGQPGVSTSIATTTQQTQVIELRKQQWTPDQDLEVRSKTSAPAIGLRHANLAVARVAPAGAMPAVPVGGLTILFDTSASRALDFDRQLADLAALLKSLQEQTGEDFTLRVVAFDQSTAEIYAGPASGFGPAEIERISTRRALGASDLRRALAAVALGPVLPRVLVISDGVATAGPRELAQIEAAARALASAGVQRIDAIVDGGIQDASTLKALTTADLAFKGVVADGRLPRNLLAHKLASATLPDMKVSVPGAAWVWPDTVEGAQPGDELLVYADLPDTAAMKVVLTGDATIETSIAMTPVERPLLERAWVGARIARLTDQRSLLPVTDRDGREALQKQVIEISTKFRVLSDFTALLVLESEWDYARFKIDRNALSDIMTVGPTGVALQNRKSLPPPQLIATREPAPLAPEANTDEEAGGTGQRHKGEEGKMGKPTSESKSGLYAMKGPKDAIPQMARNFDPAAGHGILAIGNDDADVWGGLTGTEVGEAYGVGGLGLVGTGRGGGGTGEGTISLGNTGLIGKGAGSGSGYGRGAGAGFGGRGTRVPTVRQAKAEVVGALDKDIIRRIVRAHINEVRYCYNQALARDPNAKGRVAIQFTIGGTGKVPSAVVQDTTMKDAAVGNCIAQATRRWTFPKPTDGNSVIVLYPFVLEPGGGSSSDAGLSRPITAAEREQMNQFRIDAEKLDAARARDREIERVRQEERDRIEQAEAAVAAARRDADEKIREAERASEEAENARTSGSPYSGKMFDVMEHLKANEVDAALALALRWREEDPGDVLALVALGEALEASRRPLRGCPRLRLDHRPVPRPRRPPPLRRRPPRAPRFTRPRPSDRHLRPGRRAAPRPPRQPPPVRVRPRQGRSRRRGLRRDPRRPRAEIPRRSLRWRRPHPARGRRPARRRLARRGAQQGARDPPRHRAARRPPRHQRIPSLRPHLGDRRQRRRLPHHRRHQGARLVRPQDAGLRRRAVRRRDHRLRPRVLRHPRQSGRLPLHLPGPVLQPRPDGLRHGQAADRPARRQRRAQVRRPPLRDHEGPRLRRARQARAPAVN